THHDISTSPYLQSFTGCCVCSLSRLGCIGSVWGPKHFAFARGAKSYSGCLRSAFRIYGDPLSDCAIPRDGRGSTLGVFVRGGGCLACLCWCIASSVFTGFVWARHYWAGLISGCEYVA